MKFSHRRFSHGLNSVCAALVVLGFVAGCSKSGDQTATAASDAAPASPDTSAADTAQQAPATAPVQAGTTPQRVSRANTSGPSVSYTNDPTYESYQPEEPQPVVSAYVDPPLEQPAPVAVDWAPPPLLVEEVPPQPEPDAVWTGGYWDWQGRWIWAAGRWSRPPRPHYDWQQPYYEHRQDHVVYVPGYWRAPESHFSAPAAGIAIALAVVAVGVFAGHHPDGPQGVFIPPPPGSRPGIVIPAPIGTPPSVVLGAPPVIHAGMRVEGNVERNSHNTTINNSSVTNNVTNITNVRNVTIVAPAAATANGREFRGTAPASAHLAAAQTPVFHQEAPVPASRTPIPTYQPGRAAPTSLPRAEPVRVQSRPVTAQQVAAPAPMPAQQGRPGLPVRPQEQAPQRPNTMPVGAARPGQPPPQQQQQREESARTAAGSRAMEAQRAQQAQQAQQAQRAQQAQQAGQAQAQANAARENAARAQAERNQAGQAQAQAAHNAAAQQAAQQKENAARANEARAQQAEHGKAEQAAHAEAAQKPGEPRPNAARPEEAKPPQGGERAKPQPEKRDGGPAPRPGENRPTQ